MFNFTRQVSTPSKVGGGGTLAVHYNAAWSAVQVVVIVSKCEMPTKHCSWGTSTNDSRKKNDPSMHGVVFYPFPKPYSDKIRCLKWIKLCGRPHVVISGINEMSAQFLQWVHVMLDSYLYHRPVMWCFEALPRLEAELSLPRPRSRLICLGLATASRHQSQRSQFYFCNLLHLLK